MKFQRDGGKKSLICLLARVGEVRAWEYVAAGATPQGNLKRLPSACAGWRLVLVLTIAVTLITLGMEAQTVPIKVMDGRHQVTFVQSNRVMMVQTRKSPDSSWKDYYPVGTNGMLPGGQVGWVVISNYVDGMQARVVIR